METMDERGKTRPMMHGQTQEMGAADSPQRHRLLTTHHQKTLWVYWSLVFLGAWIIFTPLTFGYNVGIVQPSGGREVWLSLSTRIALMRWNDLLCGLLLLVLGLRSLRSDRPVSLWLACFVGVWLTFAPILFWAPSALIYYNDTFVGMLVIALTILIPGMPNMVNFMEMGTDVPRGWSYNPSSWAQRWIMAVTGLLGWFVSRYLAAYQLGYSASVWDPFFGESTRMVLNSDMSHSLPISDAGLGSIAYTFEFLMAFMGSPARWRTMPWMVTFFGILVIPLGLVHIFLVISQPIVVGQWCTFCLLAALIMLPMIPLEVDEVIAMVQFMRRRVQAGDSFWKVFWKGGPEEDDHHRHKKAPPLYQFTFHPGKIIRSSFWGMNFPGTLALSALAGLTMVAISHGDHAETLVGLLVFTVSVLSMGEPLRILRFINFLLVAGLLITNGIEVHWQVTLLAAIVVGASLPKGKIENHFGRWDRLIH